MIIINVNESFTHKIAKELVFDWLITGKTKIPMIKEPIENAEFGCCEAIMFKESDIDHVPYHYFGYCDTYCGGDFSKVEDVIQKNNILIFEENRNNNVRFFKESPCLKCPFSKLEYKYIYDIAFGRKGMFTLAVEIKHTHPVDNKKIENTPFPIYEVDASWVMKQTDVPVVLKGKWISY